MWGPLVARAHVGPGVGAGHALRLLALVEGWLTTGDGAVVVGPEPDGPLGQRIARSGAEVLPAAGPPGSAEDAAALVTVAGAVDASWIVVDGSPFDLRFQRALRGAGRRVLVVDDHGRHGSYDADVVLDQNLGAEPERYAGAGGARVLLGPSHALLRREVTGHVPAPSPSTTPSTVTIVLGGDPAADVVELGQGIAAGLQQVRPGLHVEQRFGAGGHLRSWPEALASTDLAVSAAGSTSWELCYFGIPSVLVGVADDQEPVGAALARAGAARWTGRANGVTAARVVEQVSLLADSAELRSSLSAAGRRLVDGRGVARVLAELRSGLLRLRDADAGDAAATWAWANDPVTRASSFTAAAIPWEHHERWLERRLGDPRRPLLVAHGPDGSVVGQVRFDPCSDEGGGGDLPDGDLEIGVTVAPVARGRGVAAPLILAGSRRMSEVASGAIHAYVRPENAASRAAFTAAGYELIGPTTRKGVPALHHRWRSDDDR